MITKNYDLQTFKKSSSRLSKTLKSKGITVPKATLLESISHFFGFKDWNILNAQLQATPSHKTISDNNDLLFSDDKLKSITDYFVAKRKNVASIFEGTSDKDSLLAWRNQSLMRFYKLILDNMAFLNVKRPAFDIRKDENKDINNLYYYCYELHFYKLEDEKEKDNYSRFVYNIALLLKEDFEAYFEIIVSGGVGSIRKDLGYSFRRVQFKIDYDSGWDAYYLVLYIENLFKDLPVIFPDY